VDLKFDNNMPIYFQIMNWIKEQIVSNKFSSGSKLPSVRDMSEQFNVTPNTIQRVYRELEFEEIIYTQRGIGVFITQDVNKIKSLRLSMSEQLVKNFLGSMKTLGFNEDEIINTVMRTAKEGGSNGDNSPDKGSM
jgi:DNA-binding transcriptional regulator YhcF (GntR family)